MFTSLDLLVIVFMAMVTATLLSLCLMFFIKNKTAKKVFFYIVTALGLYMASVGLRIGLSGLFTIQIVVGIVAALMSIGALVLERIGRKNEKMLLISRAVAAIALVIGLFNAIL